MEISTYSLSKYASVINKRGGWTWLQDLLTALQQVGQKHGVTIADVASKWVLDRPQVPAIIVGARNARHVADHQKLFTFDLDAEDYAKINEVLDRGVKPASDCYTWERGGAW